MATQKLLREVAALEEEVEALQTQAIEEREPKEQQYWDGLEKLFKRRQELVSGKAPPTEEELQSAGSSLSAGAAGSKGLPYFWMTVLCNQDMVAEGITQRDRQALTHLTHITAMGLGSRSPVIELHFNTNPYFTNRVLKRGVLVDEEGDLTEVSTDIDWKKGKNLTLKDVGGKKPSGKKGGKKASGKKGGKQGADRDGEPAAEDAAAAAAPVKQKPCPSFFRFFSASSSASSSKGSRQQLDPTALAPQAEEESGGEEMELDDESPVDAAAAAKLESDLELLQVLLQEVVPRAMHLYLAGPLQGASSGSEGDDSEDSYALVHGAAGGSVEELPPSLQAVAAALQHNQALIDEAMLRHALRKLKMGRELQSKVDALYAKRRSLLLTEDSSSCRVPGFWLHVLRSTAAGGLAITRKDAAVLAHLADVRCSMVLPKSVDSRGLQEVTAVLELEFLPGTPYLTTTGSSGSKGSSSSKGSTGPITLMKHYTLERAASILEGSGWVLRTSKVVNAPHWSNADQDPTHARPPKDSSSDGSGRQQQQHQRKGRMTCSMFHMFRPNAGKWVFNIPGDEKEAQEEANEQELALITQLQLQALPRASACYQQAADDGQTEEWGDAAAFDEPSEDEEEDDSDADDDGEGAAAERAARRARKAAAAGPGFKLTRAHILIALLAMVVLAEFLVFLDMTGWFRSSS